MKQRFNYVLLAFFFLAIPQLLWASTGPVTCLWLDTVHVNPDSTYVDTCSSSSTFGAMYSRSGYEILFNWYSIRTTPCAEDTMVTYGWTDINSHYSSIRSAFSAIEARLGHFEIIKEHCAFSDTTSLLNKYFLIHFDSLLNVDTVKSLLATIPYAQTDWNGAPRIWMSDIPADKGLLPGADFKNDISLDGVTEQFTPSLHPLGWQWNMYKLHCPMAWEITKGLPYKATGTEQKYIHIIGYDDFGGAVSTNPDLTPNFIQLTSSGTTSEQQSGNQSEADGLKATDPLKEGHGHGCISQAISAVGHGAMIGTCPECVGMALGWGNSTKPWQIDVDGMTGNGQTPPEVEWSSASGVSTMEFKNGISEGMAIFSAAGNILDSGPTLAHPDENGGLNINYEIDPSNSSQTFLYQMVLDWPGYTAMIAGSDPAKDVHPLCIGGTMDGHLWGPNSTSSCIENASGSLVRSVGGEEFWVGGNNIPANFSCGLDKFSIASDITTRINHKNWAFMDVVAPAALVINANTSSAGYGFSWGTSESAPMVAGIAGLMRAINYYVTPDNSTPTDLAQDFQGIRYDHPPLFLA